MTEYHKYGVTLSEGQKKKISKAFKQDCDVTIRLSKSNLHGNDNLALTQTQINKIKKTIKGVQLNISKTQLKYMVENEKTGGFLPLLSLIPLIIGAVGAAGGITGGIASAVSAAKSNKEQIRHNKAIEAELKAGAGVISETVGKIPIVGNILKPLLQKIGLGSKDITKINKGGCINCNGFQIKKIGDGLYLEPQGAGVFLGPRRE